MINNNKLLSKKEELFIISLIVLIININSSKFLKRENNKKIKEKFESIQNRLIISNNNNTIKIKNEQINNINNEYDIAWGLWYDYRKIKNEENENSWYVEIKYPKN